MINFTYHSFSKLVLLAGWKGYHYGETAYFGTFFRFVIGYYYYIPQVLLLTCSFVFGWHAFFNKNNLKEQQLSILT